VSELDFSDLIVVIVYLTTCRLASLKWMVIGFDGFVEIGGVQLSDIVLMWKYEDCRLVPLIRLVEYCDRF
jgi:hypothetical protein